MKVLGFKLTNSTSFAKSVFSTGFIQKTVKVDLHVRFNHTYPQRNQHQKTLEDSRGLRAEVERQRLPGEAGRPHLHAARPPGPTCQPLLRMSVLHCLLNCIYAILLSRFDPRVQN